MKTYLQKHNKLFYTDNWATPWEIYNFYVNDLDYHDPCPLNSEVLTNLNLLINDNMFINPPYSNISAWIDFAINNHKKYQRNIILLIPSRTDTKYFHKLLKYGCDLEFIQGRLKFGNHKGSAPFPSVLVHLE